MTIVARVYRIGRYTVTITDDDRLRVKGVDHDTTITDTEGRLFEATQDAQVSYELAHVGGELILTMTTGFGIFAGNVTTPSKSKWHAPT